jgi:hypothetical protein
MRGTPGTSFFFIFLKRLKPIETRQLVESTMPGSVHAINICRSFDVLPFLRWLTKLLGKTNLALQN